MMNYNQLELYVEERRRELERNLERRRKLGLVDGQQLRRPRLMHRFCHWFGGLLVEWGTRLEQTSLKQVTSYPTEEQA